MYVASTFFSFTLVYKGLSHQSINHIKMNLIDHILEGAVVLIVSELATQPTSTFRIKKFDFFIHYARNPTP